MPSRCAGLSLSRPLLLRRSTSSRRAGSVVVAHGPSCSAACGIFPDQGSNPCRLHWQADSQPLRHQGSPYLFLKKNLFIYFWLRWVFVAAHRLSLVAVNAGYSSLRCAGFSLLWLLLLWALGAQASVVVAHGPSCSTACGIFPDQGSNPCPLHWQADSQPLRHQGSPLFLIFG